MKPTKSNQKQSGSAALRAFHILESVIRVDKPVSLDEVASACGLPKPTTYRTLIMLEQAGMLSREPVSKRYTAGARLSTFALEVLANSIVRAPAHVILQRLVDDIGETCNVTMLDGNAIVYLDRVETPSPLRLNLQPGSHVPLHCTSSGKLLLSQLSRSQRQKLIGSGPLQRCTNNTITDVALLEQELQRFTTDKVATNNEEFHVGMIGVAVPILNRSGRACASLALQAPVVRMNLEQALQHVPTLRLAAQALSNAYFSETPAAASNADINPQMTLD
ncbi:IclR family transcriptional regulator [Glaciimonas sp. Gout2]|uniref:IclR family transcriptional regulator n=2 Tax=Glaciimonas TaxID=1229970 RepID=UPI002B2343B5|nr:MULTISPECIES: IclR family transcriptional regulator [unclassified Glaciimonas]MEB0014280.1 IclR family transcriptional regulator [Glaciimonas sp. Cout2]MEB0084425.1 IclR family transcriptional regulator [Glaciimonas sp. Gout2]